MEVDKNVKKFLILSISQIGCNNKSLDQLGYEYVNILQDDFSDSVVNFISADNLEYEINSILTLYSDILRYNIILIHYTENLEDNVLPKIMDNLKNIQGKYLIEDIFKNHKKLTVDARLSKLEWIFRDITLIITLPEVISDYRESYNLLKPVIMDFINTLEEDDDLLDDNDNISPTISEPGLDLPIKESEFSSKNPQQNETLKVQQNRGVKRGLEQDENETTKSINKLLFVKNKDEIQQNTYNYPVKMSDALNIIKRIYQLNLVRCVSSECASQSLGFVTGDQIRAVDAYPSKDIAAIDGYACMSKDGNKSRTFYDDVVALDNGICTFVKQGSKVPKKTDWIIPEESVKYDKGKNLLTIENMPMKGKKFNIIPKGAYIKEKSPIASSNQLIGLGEMGLFAVCGVYSVPVFIKPNIGILYLLKNAKHPDFAIEKNCNILLQYLRDRDFSCQTYDKIINEPEQMLMSLRLQLMNNDILIIQTKYSGDESVLEKVLSQNFNGELVVKRIDMQYGKNIGFYTCSFEGKHKFIYLISAKMHSILVTANLFIIPSLMHWLGVDDYEHPRINVWLTHDVILHYKVSYRRAHIQYSIMHDCPLATILDTECGYLTTYPLNNDVVLELPAASPNRTWLEEGSIVPAILIR